VYHYMLKSFLLVAAVVLIPSYAFAQSTTHPPVMRRPFTVAYPSTSRQGTVAYPPTSPPVTVVYPPTSRQGTVAYPPTSPPVTVASPVNHPTASTPTSAPGSHSGGQVQNIESLSFWTTAPGIMTALAAFISALAALVAAFRGIKRRSSSV